MEPDLDELLRYETSSAASASPLGLATQAAWISANSSTWPMLGKKLSLKSQSGADVKSDSTPWSVVMKETPEQKHLTRDHVRQPSTKVCNMLWILCTKLLCLLPSAVGMGMCNVLPSAICFKRESRRLRAAVCSGVSTLASDMSVWEVAKSANMPSKLSTSIISY